MTIESMVFAVLGSWLILAALASALFAALGRGGREEELAWEQFGVPAPRAECLALLDGHSS